MIEEGKAIVVNEKYARIDIELGYWCVPSDHLLR